MLVYGDGDEDVRSSTLIATLRKDDGQWLSHDALRTRFIALAGLAQGVADADFASFGTDRSRPAEPVLLQALVELGAILLRSWDENCTGAAAPPLPALPPLPPAVTVREGEGYAHYALYPEAYALAARQLALHAPPLVIGLRSIGSGLAAIVAAAIGAPAPITLRPSGNPFRRSLQLDPAFARDLLQGERHYVIVDEGPGLSGSSFGCVADWLEDRGVPLHSIAFLPGHGGELGPQASARHRARWQQVQRQVVQPGRLRSWITDLLGKVESWTDVSAGAWRPLWNPAEDSWPAVVPAWERMKYLVHAGGVPWMVRFAGLGSAGTDKLGLAQLLHRRGYGPEVAGLTHGWLVQRWHDDAVPTLPTMKELSGYLAFRAGPPAPKGASLAKLVTMARRNVPELGQWDPRFDRLQGQVRAVRTDGRLQAHEWLRLPSGQLIKADALDHHRAHDLIGAQDIAWDQAGAAIELGLHLSPASPALEAFYRVAYCAFHIGAHELGKSMSPVAEAPRHDKALARYRSALVDAVEHLRHVDQSLGRGIEALA